MNEIQTQTSEVPAHMWCYLDFLDLPPRIPWHENPVLQLSGFVGWREHLQDVIF